MKYFITIAILSLFNSCSQTTEEINTQDIQEIRELMSNQLIAWNSGDHEGFMNGYWKSEDLRFCGPNGTVYGWETTLNNYIKTFPNRDDMKTLYFDIDSVYTNRAPLVTVDGRWRIERDSITKGGQFVLLFDRPNGIDWKIIEDHTW